MFPILNVKTDSALTAKNVLKELKTLIKIHFLF